MTKTNNHHLLAHSIVPSLYKTYFIYMHGHDVDDIDVISSSMLTQYSLSFRILRTMHLSF